jgi:molybdenum-dependent DNA-binding transcriptional regulator ModE
VAVTGGKGQGRTDLLRDAAAKAQRINDLERELKEVREVVAADKKKLEDELAEERRKVVEATVQFNTAATGRSIVFYVNDTFEEEVTNYCIP